MGCEVIRFGELTLTPVLWNITLNTDGEGIPTEGIHTIFTIASVHPLTAAEVEDLSGKLVWDETVVDLCGIDIRGDGGDGSLHVGDGYQTTEGCGPNPTAMQDAFDDFGLPKTACVAVRSGGVDHEFCAPLEIVQ